MSAIAVRVVKVGGSLFELSDLADRLRNWLAAQPRGVNLIIAGGGDLADVLRKADQRHGLGETVSHELCVDVLGTSARWLAAVLQQPIASWNEALTQVERAKNGDDNPGEMIILDSRDFLSNAEPAMGGEPLPRTWDVTTDSIAARLASVVRADELILLKSCPPGTDVSLPALVKSGYVDGHFASVAATLPTIRYVDLRAN